MQNEMLEYVSRTHSYRAARRLRSPKDRIGQMFTNADGHRFTIFKETVLDPTLGQTRGPEAMFRVQFQVSRIRTWLDRLVIAVKAPIFVGAPGFRSKLWMVDERTNTYQGVYEWDTLADAEAYAHSASMGFMTQVAVPGGISYEIVRGGRVVQRGPGLAIEAANG
jgi:hypothetical protein